jgi:hypothetical protein
MSDTGYDPELTHPRVSYAARYENEGNTADRAASVAARAARAMRDGHRHMDGSPRDGAQRLMPGRSQRLGPDRDHRPRNHRPGRREPQPSMPTGRDCQPQPEAG